MRDLLNLPRHIHEEILAATTKFHSHVKQAAVQVYVNVNIRIPQVAAVTDAGGSGTFGFRGRAPEP